jgi:hypothetical protein
MLTAIKPRVVSSIFGGLAVVAATLFAATPARAVPMSFVAQMEFDLDTCFSRDAAGTYCADVIEADHQPLTVTLLLAAEIADPYTSMAINNPFGGPAPAIFAAGVFTPWGAVTVGTLQGQYDAPPPSGGAGAFTMTYGFYVSQPGGTFQVDFRDTANFFGVRSSLITIDNADFYAVWSRSDPDEMVIAFSNALGPADVPLPAPALLLFAGMGALVLSGRRGGRAGGAA